MKRYNVSTIDTIYDDGSEQLNVEASTWTLKYARKHAEEIAKKETVFIHEYVDGHWVELEVY